MHFELQYNPKLDIIGRHYLPLDGMINIPIYVVWGCWVQLNSTQFFADHIIFSNGHMKHANSWQRMTNNNNNNKRKQVDTSDNPGLLSYATAVILKFKLK